MTTSPQSDNSNAYQDYLSQLHAGFQTTDDDLASVIHEATGKNFVSKKKIIGGEANEVYDCELSDSSNVIVRISRSPHGEFKQEEWAMNLCRERGIPVPQILLIRQQSTPEGMISFCVMEKIDGEPLERGDIDFSALSRDEQRAYIRQAGTILSKIHSIKTAGWGWIGQGCEPAFAEFEPYFRDQLKNQDELEQAATEFGESPQTIKEAFKILWKYELDFKQMQTCLNHADYAHKHFMVKDKQIVSIIDWGDVRSDSPLFDFANWDFWFGEYIPTQWLIDGYEDKSLFDNSFEDRLHVFRLLRGIDVLHWYLKQKYEPAIREAIIKIDKDVRYFS